MKHISYYFLICSFCFAFLGVGEIYEREAIAQSVMSRSGASDELPPPQPGRGHAKGILLHNGKGEKGFTVYLNVVKNGKFKSLGELAKTDEHGRWTVLNLEPGRYFPTGYWIEIMPQFYISDKNIREVKQGTTTDFGKSNGMSLEDIFQLIKKINKNSKVTSK
jgi:hypothetical protein